MGGISRSRTFKAGSGAPKPVSPMSPISPTGPGYGGGHLFGSPLGGAQPYYMDWEGKTTNPSFYAVEQHHGGIEPRRRNRAPTNPRRSRYKPKASRSTANVTRGAGGTYSNSSTPVASSSSRRVRPPIQKITRGPGGRLTQGNGSGTRRGRIRSPVPKITRGPGGHYSQGSPAAAISATASGSSKMKVSPKSPGFMLAKILVGGAAALFGANVAIDQHQRYTRSTQGAGSSRETSVGAAQSVMNTVGIGVMAGSVLGKFSKGASKHLSKLSGKSGGFMNMHPNWGSLGAGVGAGAVVGGMVGATSKRALMPEGRITAINSSPVGGIAPALQYSTAGLGFRLHKNARRM